MHQRSVAAPHNSAALLTSSTFLCSRAVLAPRDFLGGLDCICVRQRRADRGQARGCEVTTGRCHPRCRPRAYQIMRIARAWQCHVALIGAQAHIVRIAGVDARRISAHALGEHEAAGQQEGCYCRRRLPACYFHHWPFLRRVDLECGGIAVTRHFVMTAITRLI